MKILALDTSTLMSTCAVLEDGVVLGEYSLNQDMSHSERLIPMIKAILEELDMDISEIDLYGVATGPGSFTGLRIGAATVKGFAHVFDRPIVGVSTLRGLAYNLPFNSVVVPILDARRERVYTGIYSWKEGRLETIMEDDVVHIDRLVDILQDFDSVVINGPGVEVFRETIEEGLAGKVKFANPAENYTRAVNIAQIAGEEYDLGRVDDYYNLTPEYLRVSQAERELKEKE